LAAFARRFRHEQAADFEEDSESGAEAGPEVGAE
jgi:hypothetical protein